MKKQVAKFEFSAVLISAVVGLVIVAILAAFGQDIVGDVRDDYKTTSCGLNSTGGTGGAILYTGCSYEANTTLYGQQGVDNMSKKFPTLGTVVIAGILIATLIGFLAFRKSE